MLDSPITYGKRFQQYSLLQLVNSTIELCGKRVSPSAKTFNHKRISTSPAIAFSSIHNPNFLTYLNAICERHNGQYVSFECLSEYTLTIILRVKELVSAQSVEKGAQKWVCRSALRIYVIPAKGEVRLANRSILS
jgi:hypothetical protein